MVFEALDRIVQNETKGRDGRKEGRISQSIHIDGNDDEHMARTTTDRNAKNRIPSLQREQRAWSIEPSPQSTVTVGDVVMDLYILII